MEKRSKIFTKINPAAFFEVWYDQTKMEDNFEEHMGFLDYNKEKFEEDFLTTYAYDHGLLVEEVDKDSQEYKTAYLISEDNHVKNLAHDWYFNRLADFTSDLEKKLEIREDGIVCAREITVECEDEYLFYLAQGLYTEDYKGVGACWSWDKEKAESHHGTSGHPDRALLEAVIPFSAIDQESTLILNMNPTLGYEEAEIRVFSGRRIKLLKYNDQEISEICIKT